MKTTIELTGYPELVLQKAVDLGIARSKTDAIKIAVLSLDREYDLMNSMEADLVLRKISEVEAQNKQLGREPETEEDVLSKYPHLKNIKP